MARIARVIAAEPYAVTTVNRPIRDLARILQWDIKNVAADVCFWEQAGLIDTKKETSREISPHVTYD